MDKILFVSYCLSNGGAERVLSRLANGLARKGIDVAILLYHRREKEYPVEEGVRIIEMESSAHEAGNGLSRMRRRIKAIRKVLQAEKPTVVIPFLDSMVRESRLAARGLPCKVVATVRNSPYQDPPRKIGRFVRNRFCGLCSAVFVQNEAQKAYFNKRIQKKTFVVANPIADDLLASEKAYTGKVERFITCGRLHPQKNHKMLIEAFASAAAKYPQIRLSIYGVGEEQENVQAFIAAQGMTEHIRLQGRTEDVRTALVSHDAFLLSSNFEGMPNALMEALAVGLPCISTDCPTGPADLIETGKTGLLTPVADAKGMAEKIIELIENPAKAEEMGRAAKESMRQDYALERIVEDLLTNLGRICE